MTPEQIKAEQTVFEDWLMSRSVMRCWASPRADERKADGEYWYGPVHYAWLAWVARAEQAQRDLEAVVADAERYAWLRGQHQGHEALQFDADGLPMPMEPVALAWTVFRPDRGALEPVGCIPGELDAAIDAELARTAKTGE